VRLEGSDCGALAMKSGNGEESFEHNIWRHCIAVAAGSSPILMHKAERELGRLGYLVVVVGYYNIDESNGCMLQVKRKYRIRNFPKTF